MNFRRYSFLLLLVAALFGKLAMGGDSAPATPAPVPAAAPLPYDEKADASRDLAAALKAVRHDGRLVLLDFGANWCPDCRALSAHFNDAKVKPVLEAHFLVVPIDVGRWTKNLELSKQYGDPIKKGIPALVLLDRDGRQRPAPGSEALADARAMTPEQVLVLLQHWAITAPAK